MCQSMTITTLNTCLAHVWLNVGLMGCWSIPTTRWSYATKILWLYTMKGIWPFLVNRCVMEDNHLRQLQKLLLCLGNHIMCRRDTWTWQVDMWWRYMSIGISMPNIGMVLGHPHTSSLKPQHIEIVDIFSHHKLNINILKKVQWHFLVVVWGNVKNHSPSIHSMISDWLKNAPIN